MAGGRAEDQLADTRAGEWSAEVVGEDRGSLLVVERSSPTGLEERETAERTNCPFVERSGAPDARPATAEADEEEEDDDDEEEEEEEETVNKEVDGEAAECARFGEDREVAPRCRLAGRF